MKNVKWFYLIVGILLMFFSLDFIIRNDNVLKNIAVLIPVAIIATYLLIGLNVLHSRRMINIFGKFGFLPLIFVLMLMLNEYIENSDRGSLKESFWYSAYGPFSQSEGFINVFPYLIIVISELIIIFVGLVRFVNKKEPALKQ